VRILHTTPHLPPDHAANALLPFQLGEWARARGDSVHYLAHPPLSGPPARRADVTWIPRRHRSPLQRAIRIDSLIAARRIRREALPHIAEAELVHVHSNGLLSEVSAATARQLGKPFVLTLYGTEIWHYRPKRLGPDLFTRAYRTATAVTFYSEGLLARAAELGLARPGCRAIYPPVPESFSFHDRTAQMAERGALGITSAPLLVNVKRLHPLAGQRFLIEAMPRILADHGDARLVICGAGALRSELEAAARKAGVDRHVTFAGLVDNTLVARYCAAADLFVLPSILEALPTVAVEALASGTPVVSSDNPGGLELARLFDDDVQIVPREDPHALAEAIAARLRDSRRTRPTTQRIIDERFRPSSVAAQYWAVYDEACA
jgi:glycosyltransferase involved in cell wall biosynthesis